MQAKKENSPAQPLETHCHPASPIKIDPYCLALLNDDYFHWSTEQKIQTWWSMVLYQPTNLELYGSPRIQDSHTKSIIHCDLPKGLDQCNAKPNRKNQTRKIWVLQSILLKPNPQSLLHYTSLRWNKGVISISIFFVEIWHQGSAIKTIMASYIV